MPATAPVTTAPDRTNFGLSSLPWYALAAAVWLIAAAVAALRLARSVVGGLSLLRSCEPLSNERIARALQSAARQLSIDPNVGLYRSDQIRCPAIWGWGQKPRLLIPTVMVDAGERIEWEAIICHELAHWKRRDHATSLLAELACCLVPWQPLFWWTRGRLHQLSERACDDWALEAGHAANDYAESLLNLVPQPRSALALAAVSSGRGLVGRIRHILDSKRTSPIVGRWWMMSAILIAMLAVSAVALAQRRADVEDSSPAETDVQETAIAERADSADDRARLEEKPETAVAEEHTFRGIVRNTAGEPIPDAPVYLVGEKRHWDAAPRNDLLRNSRRVPVMDGKTDSAGRFALSVELDSADYSVFMLVAAPPDYGLAASVWAGDLTDAPGEFVITVSEPLPIEGQILSPDGQPLPSAKISLRTVQRPLESGIWSGIWWEFGDGPYAVFTPARFEFWPESVTTDADGRFRFATTGRDSLTTLRVEAEGYAPQELKVATSDTAAEFNASVKTRGSREATNFLEPNFTYVLELPRTAEGVITDAETGQPIEGVEIIVSWTDFRGRFEGPIYAVTDEQGRYRIHARAADNYHLSALPPAGYIAMSGSANGSDVEKLLSKIKVFRYDVKLTRGTMVHGRVLDRESSEPIPGVSVIYRPAPQNANRQADHSYNTRVLSDDEGRFAIATLPGKGVLVAQARPAEYVRVTLPGDLLRSETEAYPHGFAEIDVPDEQQWQAAEIILRKGPTLEVQTVGPDGQTAPIVWAGSVRSDAGLYGTFVRSERFKNGLVRMRGVDPKRVYRAFFYAPEIDAGAVADLKYDPDVESPQRLELQSAATIRGRLVYPDGTPARNIRLYPRFVYSDQIGDDIDLENIAQNGTDFYYNFAVKAKHDRKTNKNGEFELGGFISDVYLMISLNQRFANGNKIFPVGKLEPGEVRELGDLKLQQ